MSDSIQSTGSLSETDKPSPNESYWLTKEGAAFNAISELCNPDASLNERFEAADILRRAFGMPTSHDVECGINDPDLDEPDASDCTCSYWQEPLSNGDGTPASASRDRD